MTNRRTFLRTMGVGWAALVLFENLGMSASADATKPLRCIFPIAQTPFTDNDKLDLETLAEEVRFIHRGKVHGFVWPQLASQIPRTAERNRMHSETFGFLQRSAGRSKNPGLKLIGHTCCRRQRHPLSAV